MELYPTINNRFDLIAFYSSEWGVFVTDHLYLGSNREVPVGTYTPNWDTAEVDSVTFKGTVGRDVLIGGGGEVFSIFVGTAGNDIYGITGLEDFSNYSTCIVDYSGASKGVVVDMSYHGSQTFTDESGTVRTESVLGRAQGGFGGTDYFLEFAPDFASISTVIGTSHRDVMIDNIGVTEFHGGGGDDFLKGLFLQGGDGNDLLIGKGYDWAGGARLIGNKGNDVLCGTDFDERILSGGTGNDRLFAKGGDDGYVVGEAGNDTVDGGAGRDFIDGGVGSDVLISGEGSDTINPDVEFFQRDPTQKTDHARDIIRVTRADVGDYNDIVLSRAFEVGRDEIRFKEAVAGGKDYRVYHEAQSFSEVSGNLRLSDDQAGIQNTILQIDQDGDGFGGTTPDSTDYFLFVVDASLSQHSGFLLS